MRRLERTVVALGAAAALAGCDRDTAGVPAAAPAASAVAAATPAAVAACVGCHGTRGEGKPSAGFPRLAGQSRVYLLNQLAAFADGRRANPVMQGISHAVSPEQRAEAARFFAAIADAPVPAPPPAAGDVERGRELAELGDDAKQVQACKNCHGVAGAGLGMQLPYVAGKPAPYLEDALKAFRDGSRRSDPTGQMPPIAKVLDDRDIRGLAAYYAQQPPPAVPLDAAVAAR